MNNQLIPFNFEEKEVRIVIVDGQEWWVARDVATALGYKNTNDAIQKHCDGVAKCYPITDAMGRTQEARVISEGDVFRLMTHSNLPRAWRFEKWLFEKVLPQIRRTGGYNAGGQTASLADLDRFMKESVPRIKLVFSENARLRQLNRLYEERERLREQLARKNTPLSAHEKRMIQALAKEWTVSHIAEHTGRSATAIRRAIKEGKGGTK